MSLTKRPGKYRGVRAILPPDLQTATRAPTSADRRYVKGTLWLDTTSRATYIYPGSGDWTILGSDELPNFSAVSITSAQVLLLATTPIELVPAPGAGKMIKFIDASLKLAYGGTNAFTEAGDNLGINYTDASGKQVCTAIETTGFIDQTANTYTNAEPLLDAIVVATGAENQALVLNNLNVNFGGNAAGDNTLEVSVLYRVVEL